MIKLLKRLSIGLICLGLVQAQAATETSPATENILTELETRHLLFMREEEKLARDTYLTFAQNSSLRVFSNIARSEQKHMDTLALLLERYGLEDPVTSDAVGDFTNPELDALYDELVSQGETSLLEALYVGALIEEIDIIDLEETIEDSIQADVILAYENLMAGSENHLRAFVSQIESTGNEYLAQALDQKKVDEILGRNTLDSFEINPGLNDAWYHPETNGQGFFISVYPELEMMFLAWFTFDTDLPDDDELATVGDPGQRWLTAFGTYRGNQAELEIEVTRGGLFDRAEPATDREPGGTIIVTFDDCSSGNVNYDLPDAGLSGNITIQRVVSGNTEWCEALLPGGN